MQLSTFILKNTGPFARLRLQIPPQYRVCVIAGEQGSGKTTVLKHLYHALTWFQARTRDLRSSGVVMNEQDIFKQAQTAELKISVHISDELQQYIHTQGVEESPSLYSWQLKKSNLSSVETAELEQLAKMYKRAFRQEPELGLPLLAYYPAERFIHEVNLLTKNNPVVLQEQHAYDLVSIPYTTFSRFFEWLREIHDIENAQAARYLAQLEALPETVLTQLKLQPPRPHLTALKHALTTVLPEVEDLFLEYQPKLQLQVKIHGEILLYQQLSGSLKTWIALVGDVVRRLCLLNPNQLEPCLVGNGLLLIDQIEQQLDEQHLGPLLTRLQQAFPKLQIIVTTTQPELLHGDEQHLYLKLNKGQLRPFTPQNLLFNEAYRNVYAHLLDHTTETEPLDELNTSEQHYMELLGQIQQQLSAEQQQQLIQDLQDLPPHSEQHTILD